MPATRMPGVLSAAATACSASPVSSAKPNLESIWPVRMKLCVCASIPGLMRNSTLAVLPAAFASAPSSSNSAMLSPRYAPHRSPAPWSAHQPSYCFRGNKFAQPGTPPAAPCTARRRTPHPHQGLLRSGYGTSACSRTLCWHTVPDPFYDNARPWNFSARGSWPGWHPRPSHTTAYRISRPALRYPTRRSSNVHAR